MTNRQERPAPASERPPVSCSPSTFGILEEWAEGLAAAAVRADRGALAHCAFVEAYWEARGAVGEA